MLIDGLEWCGLLVDYCDVFISCLDSHSDGTHSLQRIEDERCCCCSQTAFGLVRIMMVVAPFLYVGTLISKNFAALLEEHDIFVPEDDDDDD